MKQILMIFLGLLISIPPFSRPANRPEFILEKLDVELDTNFFDSSKWVLGDMEFNGDASRVLGVIENRGGADGGFIAVWDTQTGSLIFATEELHRSPTGIPTPPMMAIFNPEGDKIIWGDSLNGFVNSLDASTGEHIMEYWRTDGNFVRSMAFSKDGSQFAVSSNKYLSIYHTDQAGPPVYLMGDWRWDEDGSTKYKIGNDGEIRSVQFSADGTMLAVSVNGFIKKRFPHIIVIDISDIDQPKVMLEKVFHETLPSDIDDYDLMAQQIEFSPDGQNIIFGEDIFSVYSLTEDQPLFHGNGRTYAKNKFIFSANGDKVYARQADSKNIEIWDVETRQLEVIVPLNNIPFMQRLRL